MGAFPPRRFAAAVTARLVGDRWVWVVPHCPFCDTHHLIGAGNGDVPTYSGLRAAPCSEAGGRSMLLIPNK